MLLWLYLSLLFRRFYAQYSGESTCSKNGNSRLFGTACHVCTRCFRAFDVKSVDGGFHILMGLKPGRWLLKTLKKPSPAPFCGLVEWAEILALFALFQAFVNVRPMWHRQAR